MEENEEWGREGWIGLDERVSALVLFALLWRDDGFGFCSCWFSLMATALGVCWSGDSGHLQGVGDFLPNVRWIC